MSEPHSRRTHPPIPMLSIRLRSDVTERSTDPLQAVVDTGADATIVPLRYLLEIGAEETAPGWLRGVTGERLPVALYFVDVHLSELSCPGVRVVGISQGGDVLLGRDVLNKLALFLDGPEKHADVLEEGTAQRLRAWLRS